MKGALSICCLQYFQIVKRVKKLNHWYCTSYFSNHQAVSPNACWPWWQRKFHSSLITFCPVTRKGISQAIEWVAGWCGRHENHNGARTEDTTEQRIRPVANVGYSWTCGARSADLLWWNSWSLYEVIRHCVTSYWRTTERMWDTAGLAVLDLSADLH